MAGSVIVVPQDGGEIIVTFAGRSPVVLDVVDGQIRCDDEAIATEVLRSVAGAYRVEDAPPDFDPAFHTNDEVNDYLDKHPDDVARVLKLEATVRKDVPVGKQQRAGILDGPHALADEDTPTDDGTPAEAPAEQEEG